MIKRTLNILVLLTLSLLPIVSKAQFSCGEAINSCRIKVSSTTHGVAMLNNLDTYLSGYNYRGVGYHYNHENFRDAMFGKHKLKYQTLFSGIVGATELYDSKQYSLMLKQSWSAYQPFKVGERLQLLAGAQMQLAGGALYIPTNGNNLVSAKMRATLAASAMAIYRIPAKKGNYTLRAQLDIPLIGAMFAPEFGQSYYEIFGLGHNKNTIVLSHPANSPSMRAMLSADIPVALHKWSSTIRLTYIADIFQSDVHDTRTHIYNHSFAVGFVKTIYKVKNNDKLKQYSPF